MADETIPVRTKICTRCGAEKAATAEHFHRDSAQRDGLNCRCKSCVNEIQRSPRQRLLAIARKRKYRSTELGIQTGLAYTRRYRVANIEAAAARQRAYRQNNPERFAAYDRERHRKHGARRRALSRVYYDVNRSRLREQQRRYRQENRDRLLAARRAKREIEKQSPKFKVSKAISGSLLQALRRKKNGASWESIVGYTRETLVAHLERQFVRGMRWDNFGVAWHIDHIVPISSFSFESGDDPEVRACWALSNLRPLWKRDNLSKHAKRTHLI